MYQKLNETELKSIENMDLNDNGLVTISQTFDDDDDDAIGLAASEAAQGR